MRDLEILYPKWISPSNPPPQSSEKLEEVEDGRLQEPERMEDIKKTRPSNQLEQKLIRAHRY